MPADTPVWSGLQRVGFLALIPILLRHYAVSLTEVLTEAGLASDVLDDPTAFIAFAAAAKLLAAAARLTGCQHFGLLLGEQIEPRLLGLAGELMCNAPTLGVALRDFNSLQYMNSTSSVSYLISRDDQHELFGYGIMERNVDGVSHVYDAAALAALNIICGLVDADRSRTEMLISHAEPRDLSEVRRVFPGAVRFNADQTGVVFPKSWLALPVRGADPARRRRLQDRVQAAKGSTILDAIAQLRREIWVALLCGEFQAGDVAQRLALSKRGLNRRLNEAGSTYSEVLDETRCEMASQLLTNTKMSMSSISLLLRFSEQSVFSRSFDRWTGFTPMEFRARELVLSSERQHVRALSPI